MSSTGSPQSSGAWLFDRLAPPDHAWTNEQLRLETAALIEERCLGANLSMDGRATTQAQSEWVSAIGFPRNLYESLRKQWGQAYVSPSAQVRFTGTACRLPAKRGLSHVEPFSGMFRRALGASPALLSELDVAVADATGEVGLVHGLKTPADYTTLAHALNAALPDDFKDILGLALRCIDSQGPRPFWWATLSDEVATHGSNATLLCSALGLGNYSDGDWVVVFDYTVANAGLLYRPTTLDAGGYAFHFPSPQTHAQGVSMALRPTEASCTELLHHALPWDVAADSVRPSVLRLKDAWTAAAVYDDLPAQRQRHRQTLQGQFPEEQPWLDRHGHRI
jgi:hypothetical protein